MQNGTYHVSLKPDSSEVCLHFHEGITMKVLQAYNSGVLTHSQISLPQYKVAFHCSVLHSQCHPTVDLCSLLVNLVLPLLVVFIPILLFLD